ncbi:MAG TPA: DNA polymerase/3'-5' exonuclease PolX [Clostridia bacterium]|nr:DNA polymerase/3'-5' exonuclease PolX [Clostridia bacterium]
MDKADVVDILNEIALLMQLKGENHFRIRAYENGARIVELLEEDLETLIEEERLGAVKGIGKTLEQNIQELVTTGKLAYYEELKVEFPETLFDLFKVPGLGPKKVEALYKKLGIQNLGELEYACLENRLLILPGFGHKTQENILKGIGDLKRYQSSFLFSEAFHVANEIVEEMEKQPGVGRVSVAGSLRRRKEIVKDVDILAESEWPVSLMDWFVSMDGVDSIVGKGDTKSSIKLKNGMGVDLRVISKDQYPYALHHFTGSKEHNTAMRHIARGRGIKMNEYGMFQGEDEILIPCKDEREIFRALDMDYIPPELRENHGEIEAAAQGKLPKLVEMEDIRGIFHIHTTYSDGRNTLEEMANGAMELGYEYIGIADHSQSAFYANGLTPEDIIKQHREIDELNKQFDGRIKILKGIESDILPDGNLDYEEDVLSLFDFVIASVHSGFSADQKVMTDRILKALDNPYITILGHPTGRLLLSREAYPVDMDAILNRAALRGVAIEINANPHRLDLDWRWCRKAKDMGIPLVISPDAHDIEGLSHVSYGVGIARKGWLTSDDVLNCKDSSS